MYSLMTINVSSIALIKPVLKAAFAEITENSYQKSGPLIRLRSAFHKVSQEWLLVLLIIIQGYPDSAAIADKR